jgi:hypothetical protein
MCAWLQLILLPSAAILAHFIEDLQKGLRVFRDLTVVLNQLVWNCGMNSQLTHVGYISLYSISSVQGLVENRNNNYNILYW